MSSKSGG